MARIPSYGQIISGQCGFNQATSHPADPIKRHRARRPENTSGNAFGHSGLYHAKVESLAYQQALAAELKNLACSGDDSVASIVFGLIRNQDQPRSWPIEPQLAADILACPAAAKLTNDDS